MVKDADQERNITIYSCCFSVAALLISIYKQIGTGAIEPDTKHLALIELETDSTQRIRESTSNKTTPHIYLGSFLTHRSQSFCPVYRHDPSIVHLRLLNSCSMGGFLFALGYSRTARTGVRLCFMGLSTSRTHHWRDILMVNYPHQTIKTFVAELLGQAIAFDSKAVHFRGFIQTAQLWYQ